MPSDDWTILVIAHPTHLLLSVNRSWSRVFGCVRPRFLVTNELHIQNTLHPQCESWCFVSIATRIKSSSLNCCKIEEACLWHEWCPSTMVERLGQTTLQLWCASDTSWPMWFCVVLKRVSQNGTERALHEGMAQMTSQLNRVCDHREMQNLRECRIPLKEARQIRCRNHQPFFTWSLRKRRNRNGTTCPSQTYKKTFFKLVQKNGMVCSSQGKEFVRWGILNQDRALRLAKNRLLKNWSQSIGVQKKISTALQQCIQGTKALQDS